MKKWCALLMTMLLILTTAGAEEFSGGKDFWDDAYRCTVENGYLTFQSDDGTTYQPIAVREGFAKAAKALAAQGGYVRRRADGADAGAAALCGG